MTKIRYQNETAFKNETQKHDENDDDENNI